MITKYYKILSGNLIHKGFQYKEGLNVNTEPFNPSGNCEPGGLYFTDVENIHYFLRYGSKIAEVEVPDGEKIYGNPGLLKKFKAHRIILKNIREINLNTVKDLVLNGVNINGFLIYASFQGHLEIVKFLVSEGADVSTQDNQSLINASSSYGHLEVVKFLVSKGADIQARNNQSLISASFHGHLETVKYLVSEGADIQDQNNQALIDASFHGHLEVVKFLVSKGADVSTQDNQSLIEASFHGHLKVVKFLVSEGADVQARNNQSLIDASSYGHLETVKYLKSKGADASTQDLKK